MNDLITVMGFVGNDPAEKLTADGLPLTSFRMATSGRRYDRKTDSWVDKESNWYTVTSFGSLAQNVRVSIEKGQPVVVRGRLEIRPWTAQERSGTSVEIIATNVGHDLSLGTARFAKTSGSGAAAKETGGDAAAEGAVSPPDFGGEPPEPAATPGESGAPSGAAGSAPSEPPF